MVVEAHWKVLKRDFLYKYVAPRLDFLLFVIFQRFVPAQVSSRRHLVSGRVSPHWKKNFLQEWRRMLTNGVGSSEHYTDAQAWICSCRAFSQHNYFLCTHLVRKATFMLHEICTAGNASDSAATHNDDASTSIHDFTYESSDAAAQQKILRSEGIPHVAPQCCSHKRLHKPPKEWVSRTTHILW
jgi:hypothetical protein